MPHSLTESGQLARRADLSDIPVFRHGAPMARVTVEDCVDKVQNRFDLVLLAAHRARQISGGAELTIDRDRDKNPVVALREIADQTITPAQLSDSAISGLQRVRIDEDDAVDEMGSLAQSAEALRLTAA